MNLPAETPEPFCAICGGKHSCSNCNLFQVSNHVPDNKVLSKARLTLPKIFKVETMAGGTFSVVSTEDIPKGTQFGPLQAKRIFSLNPDAIFPLKIFTTDEDDYFGEYYLNNVSEQECNWMIFISPAMSYEEQNLLCYQDRESIYYLAIRAIPVGEHLKVWYSPHYAKKMNKHLLEKKMIEDVPTDIRIDLNSLVKKQKIQERKSWTCKFCGMVESNVVSFAVHITEHYTLQLRKICEYCKSAFISHKNLAKHIKTVHSNGLVDIQKTNEKATTPLAGKGKGVVQNDSLLGGPLLNDILTDSMDNTNLLLPQSEFDMRLANQNMLLETEDLNVDNLLSENVKELDHFNFEIDENQEQFICDICLKEFSKLKLLILHLNKHTGKYACHTCLKIFARNENLKAHDCANTTQNVCPLCQKTFALKKYLIRHIKTYHEKTFKCDLCNKVYASKFTFKDHTCTAQPQTGKDSPEFKCTVCSKGFMKDAYLKKHMKIHEDKKGEHNGERSSTANMCEVCSSCFSNPTNLKIHMRTHSEQTFACEFCDSKFHRKDVLNNHRASHKEAKSEQFTCPICNEKVGSKKYLQAHMKHHQDTVHQCNECTMSFKQKVNLKKHVESVHRKKCAECDKKFSSYEEFLQHRTHHFDYFYSCLVCKRCVKLRGSMRRHLKKAHPEQNFSEEELTDCRVNNKLTIPGGDGGKTEGNAGRKRSAGGSRLGGSALGGNTLEGSTLLDSTKAGHTITENTILGSIVRGNTIAEHTIGHTLEGHTLEGHTIEGHTVEGYTIQYTIKQDKIHGNIDGDNIHESRIEESMMVGNKIQENKIKINSANGNNDNRNNANGNNASENNATRNNANGNNTNENNTNGNNSKGKKANGSKTKGFSIKASKAKGGKSRGNKAQILNIGGKTQGGEVEESHIREKKIQGKIMEGSRTDGNNMVISRIDENSLDFSLDSDLNRSNSTMDKSSAEDDLSMIIEKEKSLMLSNNYESTDLSNMDQTDYDGFDDLDLNIADKLVNNRTVTPSFSSSDFNQQQEFRSRNEFCSRNEFGTQNEFTTQNEFNQQSDYNENNFSQANEFNQRNDFNERTHFNRDNDFNRQNNLDQSNEFNQQSDFNQTFNQQSNYSQQSDYNRHSSYNQQNDFNQNGFNHQSDLGIPITSNLEETENILDFNNLEMELDRAFNIQPELRTPVCVSMPEIVQDVTLGYQPVSGDNAYILDNGTIIEPRDQGNVVVYILDRKFDTNNGVSKNSLV